ncbi:MAG: M10 family metallopeptidase C-terminal domain-containing protein, partial [Phreatobacter sp.]|uniref:M10 family metallopeptidase C-terminal domain-containing protein n=1 Tax=Phreatobacter sp. TaxID=1966341 RepID=UPI002733C6B2
MCFVCLLNVSGDRPAGSLSPWGCDDPDILLNTPPGGGFTIGEVYVAEGTHWTNGITGTAQTSGPAGDTVPDSTATTFTIASGQAVTGFVNSATDADWFRITLTSGVSYTFGGFGFGRGSLPNPEITLYNASGVQLAYDDDSGPLSYSRLSYTATTSGTFYVAMSGAGTSAGQYMLTANAGSSVYYPNLTVAQIADQLTHTYWESTGRSAVRWNTSTVSFNVAALEPERAILARLAFAAWSDVCGLTFNEVSTGGAIVLDDEMDGAYASTSSSGGFITSSFINIAKTWSGGTDAFDSYTYQTYLHEIGHALGLGHGGPYNGSASWSIDNAYANDIWQYTLMSYFDGADPNPDLATYRFTMTPMLADILAVQNHYGARASRTGDNIYGHNANAGSVYSFTTYGTAPSFTIYDSGGNDTLNASGYSANQTINLASGAFSSIGGLLNNIAIAVGTVIENAVGGSGADTMFGNEAGNNLTGGGGGDTIVGGGGNDLGTGGAGNDGIDGGSGADAALFSSARANYLVRSFASGGQFFTQVSAASGTDAVDTLINIEALGFNSGAQAFGLAGIQQNRVSNMDGSLFDDVLFQNSATGQVIFQNMNAGAASGFGSVLGSLPAGWRLVGSDDFTGDGRSEALVQNTTNGAIYTVNIASGAPVWGVVSTGLTSTYQAIASGDVTRDGTADVLVRDTATGVNYNADMHAGGTFGGWVLGPNLGTGWRTVGLG